MAHETSLDCPRCGSKTTQKKVDSPVAGRWEIYGCSECNYLWRSTEDLTKVSKLTPERKKAAIWLYGARKT